MSDYLDPRPGRAIPLSTLRSMWETGVVASTQDVSGQSGETGASGLRVAAQDDRWFLISLTAQSDGADDYPPAYYYSFEQVTTTALTFDTGGGTISPPIVALPDGLVGSFGSAASPGFPAIEVGGNEEVPTGVALWAWLADSGDCLLFSYPPDGGTDVNITYTGGSITYNGTAINTPYGTPVTISGNTNNLATPSGWIHQITTTGTPNLTGIVAGACGRRLLFVNDGTGILTLTNEDTASTAANRFRTPFEQPLLIPPDHAFELLYDCDISRWRVLWASYIFNPGHNQAATLGTDQDDYSFDRETPTLSIDLSADVAITGFAGGVEGYLLRLGVVHVSPGEYTLTLKHLNGGSTATNQIVTPGGEDYPIASGGGCTLYYTGSVWRVLDTRDTFTDPGRVLVVGAKRMAEEKAGLKFNNDRQLAAIVNDGTNRPEFGGIRRGSADGDLSGGEEVSRYAGYARASGSDVVVGGVDVKYGGTGTQQTGSAEVFAYSGGVKTVGLTIHAGGNAEFGTANTANKYLGTDASGYVVTKDAAATLTNTYVGYGGVGDTLTGSSDFTYVAGVLGISYSNTTADFLGTSIGATASQHTRFQGRRARGSVGAEDIPNADDHLVSLDGYAWSDVSSAYAMASRVLMVGTGSDKLGRILFQTSDAGGLESLVTRVSVEADGDLRVSNVTASTLLCADADKDVKSVTLDSSLTLSGATLSVTSPATGTNTGDQNLFSTIAVSGQSNIVADATSDTLTVAAGAAITITTNAGTDTLTVAVSTVPEANGGTNQTTYATGDMLYASGANTLAKLAAGTNGKYLRMTGGVPVWTAVPGEMLGWDATDADESTSSASPVALTTADEITWTSIAAEDVIVEFHAQTYNSSVANNSARLLLDGGTVTTRTQGQSNANVVTPMSPLICKFNVSAGSHTIAMRYFTDAGTAHWLFRTLRVYRA